jgi:hypothetical protein
MKKLKNVIIELVAWILFFIIIASVYKLINNISK